MKHDLNKIINDVEIPEPSEEAKTRALEAAMAEFRKQNASVEKKIKGIEDEELPMGKVRSIKNHI